MEYFNYDNYVFSQFHINPYKTAFTTGILLSIWLLADSQKLKLKRLPLILMVIFCLVSVPVGIEVSGMILAKSSLSLKGPAYVTQKAKQSAYGNDFLFIEFIKQYLLSEKISVVYIPPYRLPWRHTGDPGIMNSLLYPATTTSNYSLTPYIIISSEADGSVYHLWPDFIVAADKIIIYDWSTGQGRVYSGRDWDPAEWQDQKPWGLIIRKQI